MNKEASARIKINKLLEESGWRFFDNPNGKANIVLENKITLTKTILDEYGNDFEKVTKGYIDFLLLDNTGFPLIVLEAKRESINPLFAKEQAREYANNQKCRFVILSNGNLHYFWDLQVGTPYLITSFPSPQSVKGYSSYKPNPQALINETIALDYVVKTQKPDYVTDPAWLDTSFRDEYTRINKLKFLRPYQLNALKSIQTAVQQGSSRFLFEMATGTGKTLVAAAAIKMFLRSGNATRVLFLVDRLELEDQAQKAFTQYLKNDYKTVIYKENRDNWRRAEIVVSTVQSLQFNNKYQTLFSPTDFNLVISDEAHRSIGGNSRAVFEYFLGYKLGLTATPKDYLKKIVRQKLDEKDPREFERRMLLDTYKTFGCENSQPTFRYSLLDGVKDGYLINPIVADARTEITTQMLSDKGYSVISYDEDGNEEESFFFKEDFEKRLVSEESNLVFCQTFLKNALCDPISGEIGKSIVYCVSQNHAAKIVQVLNEIAMKMFPDKYQSDFAIQVTSRITDAQQFAINFSNNKLKGNGNFIETYKTSKIRVCVTVGMMTTGYDCTDLLNLCMMRPIFSPTDFIQMKGRGTRKHRFTDDLFDEQIKEHVLNPDKEHFKLFDFFANCEYFEEKFNYDVVLELPFPPKSKKKDKGPPKIMIPDYTNFNPDPLKTMAETSIGLQGMKIDRMLFQSFETKIREDSFIVEQVKKGKWDTVTNYVTDNILNKPEDYYTVEKLRKAANVDRKLTIREIIEKILGFITDFKSKDQLLDEEFNKFLLTNKPDDSADINSLKYFFRAYITDANTKAIIDQQNYNALYTNDVLSYNDYSSIPPAWREAIPDYVNNYVQINQFADLKNA